MARLPYLEKDDVAESDQDLLSRDINLAKLLVHSPGGARSFARLGNWIRHKSNLDPRLRELAILQVGYMTRTEYEYSHHIKIGRDFGLSDNELRAVAIESNGQESGIDEIAKLTLLAAREMTDDLQMSEDTFRSLTTHLGSEGIMDLTIVIGFYNGVVRLLKTMDVDTEDSYLPYLDEFPLPEQPQEKEL